VVFNLTGRFGLRASTSLDLPDKPSACFHEDPGAAYGLSLPAYFGVAPIEGDDFFSGEMLVTAGLV
jgi:hypothetical protein